jgi:Co/Zn/Cd efflux system component
VHEFHVWSLNMSTFLCTVHVVLQTDDTKEVNRTVDRYTNEHILRNTFLGTH